MAILAEVIETSVLKASQEFTKLGPSLIVILSYAYPELRLITIGIICSCENHSNGCGLRDLGGNGERIDGDCRGHFCKQMADTPAIIAMLLIISGVVSINLFSKTVSH